MSNLQKSFITILLTLASVFMLLVAYDYDQLNTHGITETVLSRASPYWLITSMWVLVILSLILVLTIILTWLTPKPYLAVKRSYDDGSLAIAPSAIEGYVKCILAEDASVYNPKVKVVISKKNLRVDINTQVAQSKSVVNVAKHLEFQLKRDLEDFLGVTQDPEVHVNITARAPTKATPRVV